MSPEPLAFPMLITFGANQAGPCAQVTAVLMGEATTVTRNLPLGVGVKDAWLIAAARDAAAELVGRLLAAPRELETRAHTAYIESRVKELGSG